jgi:16S rRNA (cytosine1407-C5)-methyltransferase
VNEDVKLKPEFVDYIQTILPSSCSLDEFIQLCRTPLRRSIRVNTLKISVTDFIARMTAKGWLLQPIPWCSIGFWVERADETKPLGNTMEHLAGLFYVQEASSMLPPEALFFPKKSWQLVLDMASAPGSKTTQIAALMANQGCLVANEFSASRMKSLHANVQRLGVQNTALTHFDAQVFGHYCEETFDAILLDAPCGGEGTIRKDQNALDDWSFEHIDMISNLQKKLMLSAFRALKVGGTLVYSTCTLNHYENQSVCLYLQEKFGDAVRFDSLAELYHGADQAVTPEGFLHVWPHMYDSEGFFIAKITKTAAVEPSKEVPRKIKPSGFARVNAKLTQEVDAYFQKQFGLCPSEQGVLMQRNDEIWLYPEAFAEVSGKVRFDRVGIRLADVVKKGFRTHHDAVMSFLTQSTQMIQLTAEEAATFLKGQDISKVMPEMSGEALVGFNGFVLGLCKVLPTRLKNNLPRQHVRDAVLV